MKALEKSWPEEELWQGQVPMTTDYEFANEIVDLGRGVPGLRIGQSCPREGHVICTESHQSRSCKFHLDLGTRAIGINVQGVFTEYLKLSAFSVTPLPNDIPDEIDAILGSLGNDAHTDLSSELLGKEVLTTNP